MDLSQFSLITVLSIFLTGISEATSWGSNELDRRNGYDLQRGPVFYEAYYPDDQGASTSDQESSPINHQTGRRYFDQARVLEKTYQTFEDPQNMAYERSPRHGEEALYSDSQGSRNLVNLRSSDQAYEVARQLKRFVEGLEQDPSPSSNLDTRNFENLRKFYEGDGSIRTFHRSNPYQRMDSKTIVPNENDHTDEKLDEAMNIILSAIKKEALEISEQRLKDTSSVADITEDNVRISRQQRFVESEGSFARPHQEIRDIRRNFDSLARSAKPSVELPITEVSGTDRFSDKRYLSHDGKPNSHVTFEGNNQGESGPVAQLRFAHMENIFQPRPQVISYVFSPSRTATAVSSSDGRAESKSTVLNDQPLGRYGNNLVVGEIKTKVEKSDGLGIASIEVSEMPRHKTRHHHGEKPRRNHQRNATAKTDQ